MERVKQNLRRRIQDSHEHAKVVAIILGILGFFNALFHNHSSKATSTFWRFLITFVVNLVPKTDYVPSPVVVDGVAYVFTTVSVAFVLLYIFSPSSNLKPALDEISEEENEQRNLSKQFIMSKMQQNQADQTSATAAPATHYTRTPKAQHRTPTAGSASVRTPASGGGGPASAGGGIARTPHSRAPPSGVTAVASPSYTPKGHRSAVNVMEEAPQHASSPIVVRFDQLANHPGSASERKRRRDRLADQELIKSAAKNQAGTHNPSDHTNHFGVGVQSPYEMAPPVYQTRSTPSNWGVAAQRPPSAGGGTTLPRSTFSSPQTNQLFSSPNPIERVRKLSDEEKRTKCKRWIARAVLSRVEDTINQYSRTKTELEHLKKHKDNVKRVAKDDIERAYGHQKESSFKQCTKWSEIWQYLSLSGQVKQTLGFLRGGCKELFMFEGNDPDPQVVVQQVWGIHIDEECKKTQLYRDARVKCKSIKERFFNMERRFACYKKCLRESPVEFESSGDEDRLREEMEWFRRKIEEESGRMDNTLEKGAEADRFWRFFECAMNDLVYKDESLSLSSFENTGAGLFVLQKSKRFLCTEELRLSFCEQTFAPLWTAAFNLHNSAENKKGKTLGAAAGTALPPLAAAPVLQLNTFGAKTAAAAPLFGANTGFAFGAAPSNGNQSGNYASDLWPYYKLWLEHHWRKKIKQDVKKNNDLELMDENSQRGLFTNILVVSQDESQHSRPLHDTWPKFKIHICARPDKVLRRRLLDRIDIISAHNSHDGPKSELTFNVKSVDDVISSISTFSENLHENLRIRPDDVLGDALNIKSLRGIETFMHLL